MAKQRLLSLDILRGLTVAGMILVNNGYGESFEMLGHSKWNGMTPCDLVFPFFLFIMGISCYLSLSGRQFAVSRSTVYKICKRTVLLFAIGLFINWFHMAVKGDLIDFAHLRLWGVMQRIALCYFFVSMFALFVNHRYTIPTIVVLLAAYAMLLVMGNGYVEDADTNILSRVDRWLFGYDHLYHKSPVDPEGLVGTLSSVAHVLIGFYCGKMIATHDRVQAALKVFAIGTVCIIAGYMLTYGLPLNKRVWCPSFVLVTCGLAALLQALFINLEERWQKETFFRVFGANALAIYVFSELLAIVFHRFEVHDAIYAALHAIIPWVKWASLAYAMTFVAICYALGYVLYRKRIYIKL